MNGQDRIEDLLREFAPQVLGALVRRYGQFDACEDAVQEARLAAALQWPAEGVPDRPRSWLLTVAARALVDGWRADSARRRRETAAALDPGTSALAAGRYDAGFPGTGLPGTDRDDTLVLLFLCCHPALSPPSQLALTLRAVGGLSAAQIAAAFLVPEATIAKRISRAKQRIRDAGARFELPAEPERGERLGVVLHVLYLVFNEGYTTSSGPALQRPDLTAEAIRLTRLLYRLLPGETEVAGLLALMLLTDARRAARTDGDGRIVPLAEQRRDLWDATAIADGQAILTRTLGTGPVGPYQLQAAIAALHDEAPAAGQTDWPQILALYDVLAAVAPGPVVTLSRAVALAMVHGPRAGLALLGTLDADDRIASTHRLDAVRAHLLEQAGNTAAARESYLLAARMTASLPEQRYLELRAARLHRSTPADQPDRPALAGPPIPHRRLCAGTGNCTCIATGRWSRYTMPRTCCRRCSCEAGATGCLRRARPVRGLLYRITTSGHLTARSRRVAAGFPVPAGGDLTAMRLIPVRANGRPAAAAYMRDRGHRAVLRHHGLGKSPGSVYGIARVVTRSRGWS